MKVSALSAFSAATTLLIVLVVPGPALAVGGNCNEPDEQSRLTGWSFIQQHVFAVDATYELNNESLCTKPVGWNGASLSTTWAAVTGDDSTGLEIFQVGVIKCQYAGCPVGNQYFWAYGRTGTVGGCDLQHPAAHFLGAAPVGGTAHFVILHFTGPAGLARYSAQINGVEKTSQSLGNLDACWANGPKRGEFMNETYDQNDQVGGRIGDPNWVTGVKYQNTLQWVSMNETLGSNCPEHRPTAARCTVSFSVHDRFKIYDARVP